jgi:hypothetical protein
MAPLPSRGIPARWTIGLGTAATALSGALLAAGCHPEARKIASSPVAPPPAKTNLEKVTIAANQLPRYAGSEGCVKCHGKQAGQLRTHHFHTLSRAAGSAQVALFSRAEKITDTQREVTYEPFAEGPKLGVKVSQGGSEERVTADWVFGSGNRAFTYVGTYDGQAVELRISHYRSANRWDFTPGQLPKFTITTPVGKTLSPDDAAACLNCHTTAAVVTGGVPQPQQSMLGLGCEGCHGPGRDHISAVQSGAKDLKMLRLSDYRDRVTTELCGSCHRTAATGGDPHDPTVQGQLPRLQGPSLAMSRCFKESGGKMTCLTCHDPHRDSSAIPRAEYNRDCVDCHGGPAKSQTQCPRAPTGDCVSCHMPAQSAAMPTNPLFHTHWIKVWK